MQDLITKILSGGLFSAVGYVAGGIDGMFLVLLCFMLADILTGVLKGMYLGKLSSNFAFKSLMIKKTGILISVGISFLIDTYLIAEIGLNLPVDEPVFKLMMLGFLGMEFVSINENLGTFMKFPAWYKNLFEQLNDKNGKEK